MRTDGYTISGLRVCSVWLRPFPPGALQEELRNIKKNNGPYLAIEWAD